MMNNNRKSFLGSAIALAALAVVAPSESVMALEPTHHNSAESVSYSKVQNPKIPSSLSFAGKRIDLDPTAMAYTHGNTLLGIKRANRYFPVLAPILKKNGIPDDMIYLAVIESTLNPRALSPAKAGGLWQFMPSTARE